MPSRTFARTSYPQLGSFGRTASATQHGVEDIFPEDVGLRNLISAETAVFYVVGGRVSDKFALLESTPGCHAARVMTLATHVVLEPKDVPASWGFQVYTLEPPADVPSVYGGPQGGSGARLCLPDALLELGNQMVRSLENEPIEYGRRHPAQDVLAKLMREFPGSAGGWATTVLESVTPYVAADFIRCLGRNPDVAAAGWGFEIANRALASGDLAVRDAAVGALETWGGSKALEILKRHRPMEQEKWLSEYIEQVIQDLQES